jgi:hypothetical protein
LSRQERPRAQVARQLSADDAAIGRRAYVSPSGLAQGAGAQGAGRAAGGTGGALYAGVAHERTRRESSLPRRSRRLLDAIRERFPNLAEFYGSNERQARRDARLLLTQQIFSDIDRGHIPTPHHLYALAAGAGWSFERVCLEFGVDFAQLGRLHAALGIARTRLDLSRRAFAGLFDLPTDIAPYARAEASAPLGELVAGWTKLPFRLWMPDERYIPGEIGRDDNIAFPRLPPGAAVLVDSQQKDATDRAGYYAVEHPNGISCCRVALEGGVIQLLSEGREWYPRLDYPIRHVRVRGKVVAFAGRVDRMQPPRPVNLADLLEAQRPLLEPERVREMSSPAMIRDVWARRGMTFARFEDRVRMLRRLAGSRFSIARGHMHDLMQADATTQESPPPRLPTLYALAAIFLLDPVQLLRGYGLSLDDVPFESEPDAGEADRAQTVIGRLTSQRFVQHLRERGWEVPWLCSLVPRVSAVQRVYYLGDPGAHISPLLSPDAFVMVNMAQRKILTRVQGRPVSSLADWMRPIYLLQTDSPRRRYLCGYVEEHGEMLHVVPHPDAPSQRVLKFRRPEQAIIVGRVTHVATLID